MKEELLSRAHKALPTILHRTSLLSPPHAYASATQVPCGSVPHHTALHLLPSPLLENCSGKTQVSCAFPLKPQDAGQAPHKERCASLSSCGTVVSSFPKDCHVISPKEGLW